MCHQYKQLVAMQWVWRIFAVSDIMCREEYCIRSEACKFRLQSSGYIYPRAELASHAGAEHSTVRLAERTKAELASHAAAEHSTVRLADRTKQEFPNAVELGAYPAHLRG